MNKKIILTIIILIIIIGGIFIYRGFIKEKPLDFKLEKVFRGSVYQEVVETGIIQAGEKINLSFKSMGRIEEINVGVGDIIQPRQILAKIDASPLYIQLNEAKAVFRITEAGLARLLAGASEEEIKVAQATVDGLEKQLIDLERSALQKITQAYQQSFNVLLGVELKVDNAFNVVDSIQRRYFTINDQEGIRVRDHRTIIQTTKEQVKFYLKIVQDNPTNENINTALLKTRENLEIISNSLIIIREICDVSVYRHRVSDIDKTSLDAQRAHITTALIDIKSAQESLTRIKIETDLQLTQIKGQLDVARRQLGLIQTGPRQTDIDLHHAQIDQARARKNFLEKQIQESILKSPIEGKITEIHKKAGEITQPAMPVISLLPTTPFLIEVNIYEEDVAKIAIGNPVKVELIAFPNRLLKGKVVSINPTETLIGGVVHYETTIAFIEELPKGIRLGMTADIIIQTALKENVLIISEDAIQDVIQGVSDKIMVEVLRNGVIEKQEIEIGLRGEDRRVEVISGLKEGEQVIVR